MLRKCFALLLLAVMLTALPWPANAQEPEPTPFINWQELPTQYFLIVYAENITLNDAPLECPACGPEPASRYAAFADEIYNNMAGVFKINLETPINLRLFPTEESYRRVNLLVNETDTTDKPTTDTRSEIAVVLPRLLDEDGNELSEARIANNFRQEIVHLFAANLSDNKLNTGFQEGTGQYLEKPDETMAAKVEALRVALEQNTLFTWAEIKETQPFYDNPGVAYAQALSMVAFLVDRYGLPAYLDFIKVSAQEPGYRSALEATYGKSADALETEWLEYLPDYIAQRWEINAVYAYDLGRLENLVNKGAYNDAEKELAKTLALLQSTQQPDTLAKAETLLNRIQQGKAAGTLADDAYRALQSGDYPQAIQKGNASIDAYQKIGYFDRIPEIQDHVHRAMIGQRAIARLDYGEQLLNSSLNIFQAEKEIYEATVLLQSLNNQTAAARGLELLNQASQRQRMLAYGIAAVGVGLLLFSLLRRIYHRFIANPLEVEFTS